MTPGGNPSNPASETARRIYTHARRDMLLTVWVWAVALVWTVGYCWLRGYAHEPDSLWVKLGLATTDAEVHPLHLGMPNWVFWGVVLPWMLCSCFTMVLSFLLPDDPLDQCKTPGDSVGN
jgi:hypothetical protein